MPVNLPQQKITSQVELKNESNQEKSQTPPTEQKSEKNTLNTNTQKIKNELPAVKSFTPTRFDENKQKNTTRKIENESDYENEEDRESLVKKIKNLGEYGSIFSPQFYVRNKSRINIEDLKIIATNSDILQKWTCEIELINKLPLPASIIIKALEYRFIPEHVITKISKIKDKKIRDFLKKKMDNQKNGDNKKMDNQKNNDDDKEEEYDDEEEISSSEDQKLDAQKQYEAKINADQTPYGQYLRDFYKMLIGFKDNINALNNQYKKLSREYHPDKTKGTTAEQFQALGQVHSAIKNKFAEVEPENKLSIKNNPSQSK